MLIYSQSVFKNEYEVKKIVLVRLSIYVICVLYISRISVVKSVIDFMFGYFFCYCFI